MPARQLLLISTTRTHGTQPFEHCEDAVRRHFAGLSTASLLFVPYALADHEGYAAAMGSRLARLGISLTSLHQVADPCQAVRECAGIYVGGGNTFRLLAALEHRQLLEPIRQRVAEGVPYMGSSAGSNLACPTIMTTNDMPIIQPDSFRALGLVPFQINPHFIDADPSSTHQGETRETRIAEYHEENSRPVVGLREGSWLVVQDDACQLAGAPGGVLFQRGQTPRPLRSGDDLSFLLQLG